MKLEILLVVEDSNWTICTFVLCHSATRWWSQFEVIHQMPTAFGDIEQLMTLPLATSTKLLQVLDDPAKAKN